MNRLACSLVGGKDSSLGLYFIVQLSLVPTEWDWWAVNNNSDGDEDGSSSSSRRATHGMLNISHCIYFGQIHQMNHLHCSVTVKACSSNMDTHPCKMLERRNTRDDVTQTVWVLLLDSIYSFWVSFTFSFYHLHVSKTQATHSFFGCHIASFILFFSFSFCFQCGVRLVAMPSVIFRYNPQNTLFAFGCI